MTTDRIDISPGQLEIVQGILKSHLPAGVHTWAFGSRATWTAKDFSDLDLALQGDEPLDAKTLLNLKTAFEESALPWKVDVIDLNAITPEFRAVIEAGKVRMDWRQTTWGDEVTLEYGKRLQGYAEGTGPVGWTSDFLHEGPGIILGRKGAYRGVQFSAEPFFVIDTAYYVVPKTDLDMRWLYYAIIYHKLGHIDDGSPIPSTTRAAVYVKDLEVPSPDEQHEIASVLGALDDKIDVNRRMNETLEAMARAIFKDWFVDFGPTRRKSEGATDPHKILGGLFPDTPDAAEQATKTATLFPANFDNNNLPTGWEHGILGDEVTVAGGGTPSTKESLYWEGGNHHWVTPKDLASLSSPVLLDSQRKLTDLGLEKISSGLLPVGTVLLSSRAPIGYLAIAEIPTAINQGFIAMVCDQALPNLYMLFWCDEYMDMIKSNANGSTFQEISKRNFKPLPIIVPSTGVIVSFMDMVEPLYNNLVSNLQENQTLANLRDTLLPKLMSGEIHLRNAEKELETLV